MYDVTIPSVKSPEDILLELEAEAEQEFDWMADRPDFVRVGRKQYVAKRRSYLVDKGHFSTIED